MPPVRGPPQAASRVLAGAAVIPRPDWHGAAAKLTHLVGGRLGPWPETPAPCHVGLSAGLPPCQSVSSDGRALRERARGAGTEVKATVFCNQIVEVTPHHFCHILAVRSESLGPADTERQGFTQGHECRGQAPPRAMPVHRRLAGYQHLTRQRGRWV